MVLVQKWPLFQVFLFRQYRLGKCPLWYSRTKKRLSRTVKTRSLKGQKIGIFPKGLTHGFGPKMAIVPSFFFRQYRPGKCPLWYPRTKKRLSTTIKTRSLKGQKIGIFPIPMVLVQKWPFFQLFFWGTIGQENVFYDTLERENTFLGSKSKKFKNSKNWLFSKGVNKWFWSKNGHLSKVFFKAR